MNFYYRSTIIDVPQIDDLLNEVNQQGGEIVCLTHLSESQQLLVLIREPETPDRKWSRLSPEDEEKYRQWWATEKQYQERRESVRKKKQGG